MLESKQLYQIWRKPFENQNLKSHWSRELEVIDMLELIKCEIQLLKWVKRGEETFSMDWTRNKYDSNEMW